MATSLDERDDPLHGMRTARGAIDIVKGLEVSNAFPKDFLIHEAFPGAFFATYYCWAWGVFVFLTLKSGSGLCLRGYTS